MNRYYFQINLGSKSVYRAFTDVSQESAEELALSSLSDAEKERVRNVSLCCVMWTEEVMA